MKIVVLAGGLSPERNVSLSSGTMIAHALRGLGHQAALVDMYFGLEAYTGPVADYFDAPLTDQWKQVDPKAPDLAEIRAARKWQSPSQFGQGVLEQYVAGREIQVAILAGQALPSIEIIPKEGFYDYENKYQPGAAEEVCPAPIPPAWEQRVGQAALTVYHALGLSVYSRADFIVDQEGTPWFLEINTLPGMTPTSLVPQEAAAVGIDYASLCQRIIEESLRVRKG